MVGNGLAAGYRIVGFVPDVLMARRLRLFVFIMLSARSNFSQLIGDVL